MVIVRLPMFDGVDGADRAVGVPVATLMVMTVAIMMRTTTTLMR